MFPKLYLLPFSVTAQWLSLALSNGTSWVGVFQPLTWERKQIQFPKRCVLECSLEYRMKDKVQTSSNPEHYIEPLKWQELFCC
jgi:hypothetical protein